MRKSFLLLCLLLFCLIGLTGRIVNAQTKIYECCILKRSFTDIDPVCEKGAIVGPETGLDCYGTGTATTSSTTVATEAWGMCCLFNSIYTIANWVMVALVTASVLIGAFGGWLIATSGGNPGQVEKGRNYILYAIVGIIVGLVARGIPGLVRLIMKG